MNNTVKIILSIVGFVVCALIGFFATEAISKVAINRSDTVQYGGGGSTVGASAPGPKPTTKEPARPIDKPAPAAIPNTNTLTKTNSQSQAHPEQSSPLDGLQRQLPNTTNSAILPVIEQVSKPEYNESTAKYTFIVHANMGSLTYVLCNGKQEEIQTQSGGEFKVPGISGGKYFVYVKDVQWNKSEYYPVEGCWIMMKKISTGELQDVLNSGNSSTAQSADFKNRVASNCRYVFSGRDESEGEAPTSYNEIINRVKMRTWASVSVLSVSHNARGQLSKATIQVNY